MIQTSPLTGISTAPNLKGEIALVTGSGRGLGKAIAQALAKGGADIVLHDLTE